MEIADSMLTKIDKKIQGHFLIFDATQIIHEIINKLIPNPGELATRNVFFFAKVSGNG